MMNSTCRHIFLVLIGVLALSAPASAQQTQADIRQMLEQRDRDIKARVGSGDEISDERKEELRSVINDVIDFQAMGEAALGRHWSRLTAEQQDEFVDTFSKIIRSQSLASLDVYRSEVTYDEITVTGENAHVVTTTIFKNVPTKVEYELHYIGGAWIATDIILDEVSTVGGYARSFQSVIRKKGFDELMIKLYKKLEEVESAHLP